MTQTRTLAEFEATLPWQNRVRDNMRDLALRVLALGKRINNQNNWLRFPFYHHIFDDECEGFHHHLNHLKNIGDFVTLDDAVEQLTSGQPIDGRYFCLTFDDGFKSCMDNAMPALVERDIPAGFYIVTDMMGRHLTADDPTARAVFGFRGKSTDLDFITWDDCREMVAAGMTIGSHTCSHPKLIALSDLAVSDEMTKSKRLIEKELDAPCQHFCAPYGIPNHHFDVIRDPDLAKAAGYTSFVTGQRGAMTKSGNPFFIQRDQLRGAWGLHQLRYFLSRP